MPATESTWRDLKLMHVVFAVSSVAMLLTTIWMLAADHSRSWKQFQRKFRDIETWTNTARIAEQQTSEYQQRESELKSELQSIQEETLSAKGQLLFAQFVAEAKKTDDEGDIQAANLIEQDVATLAGYSDPTMRRNLRMDLYNRMSDLVQRVRFREDNLARNVKFRRAALDKALADYSLGVGKGATAEQTANLQIEVDKVQADVQELTAMLQQVQTHRKELGSIFTQITAKEDAKKKSLEEHQGIAGQLAKTRDERAGGILKTVAEMPLLDAFNSPLKVDQIWLPNLTLNNNFRDVARFDRCTTCHQAIDKTAVGSAVAPLYDQESTLTIKLPTPEEPPKPAEGSEEQEEHPTLAKLQEIYGIQLWDSGRVRKDDVTVAAVHPGSPAAQAGLLSGDVLVRVNDASILNIDRALDNLLVNVKWGEPLSLTIRRGVPHPYAAHPRLDLFVGSTSPHPMGMIGCTICHQGQGSATAFEYASHTPSSPRQAIEWQRKYGWFDNHHWIFPMYPKQFAEAACLKCHHEVVDLEPSPRFPDPPAPQLVKGYELVREYGCFGCHEINGWAGPQKRVGPDLRTEPVFASAAAQIEADPGFAKLSAEAKQLVERVMHHPEDKTARARLHEVIEANLNADSPVLSSAALRLEGVLKETETPGTLRKVGPSLRFVGSKVGFDWLYSWIRNPRDFRPSTKMPRFFGLWDHLVPEEQLDENGRPVLDEHGHGVMVESKGLKDAQRYEPIEVRAIANYLLRSSQKFEYLEPFKGITAQPSLERGKKVFETRGCLACHQHKDFPQAQGTQGPNLSRIGAKLGLEPQGARWLYSWVREPNRYHLRTVMPNVMLTPITLSKGQVSDPAADATAYLMQSTEDWKPSEVPQATSLAQAEHEALYDLGLEFLKEKFPLERAKQYIAEGIPESRGASIAGAEEALVRRGDETQTERVLTYVGRRSIAKYGCSGCHDIPGFEDAKPIGTALADWGRKDPARLAFEQVGEFITHHAWPRPEKGGKPADNAGHPGVQSLGEHENIEFAIEELGPVQGWLMEKLLGHEREGFLWQKLRAPRSFDFKKTENKGYNERLRMPQFNFSQEQIEQVMTFVLGLVAEPPAPQYVASYNDNPRQRAIIAGTKVVEQFNCAGCHQLGFERWDVAFKPGELGSAPHVEDFPFVLPHYTDKEIAQSKQTDRCGLVHGQLYGRALVNAQGEPVTSDENEEGDAFEDGGTATRFVLWSNILLDGQSWLVGAKNPLVPNNRVTAKYSGRGGDLGNWIYPAVIADEQAVNPNAKPEEAWGWLPPPLVGEGQKVQTNWLHAFLLDPFPIRPAVVLRMPKFNMSSDEASGLVDYFAARDDAPSPYEFDPRVSSDYLSAAELSHPNRLGDAVKIVTDSSYCVKCHLVGDFTPAGSPRALAPQLDRVNERMRPDYVHRWIANPKRILPYTGMPVAVEYNKPLSQALFRGTSEEQLDALVDLLMNWNRFAKSQFSVKQFVRPAPGAATPPTSE